MEFNFITLISVFGAALASSLHCTAMCGGIAFAATESKWNLQAAYHGSRLLGYLLAGALAGFIGSRFGNLPLLGTTLPWVLGALLLATGIYKWFDVKLEFKSQGISKLVSNMMRTAFKMKPFNKASLIGFASVFLPCGLLYSFILLALASHSLFGGTLILFFFWLGTVPALAGGQILLQKILKLFHLQGKKVTALLMIIAGLWSIQNHVVHAHPEDAPATPETLNCH